MSLFLHFSSTYTHQSLVLFLSLYILNVFTISSYIIHIKLYNILFHHHSSKWFQLDFIQSSDLYSGDIYKLVHI